MNIKLHLDDAEYDPIERTAEAFGCSVEDVVYAAMNNFMLAIGGKKDSAILGGTLPPVDFEAMRMDVINTRLARKDNLPLWADSAGSVHNYEGFGPDYSTKSKNSAF